MFCSSDKKKGMFLKLTQWYKTYMKVLCEWLMQNDVGVLIYQDFILHIASTRTKDLIVVKWPMPMVQHKKHYEVYQQI